MCTLQETEPLARLLDLRIILVFFEEYIRAAEQYGHKNDNTQSIYIPMSMAGYYVSDAHFLANTHKSISAFFGTLYL